MNMGLFIQETRYCNTLTTVTGGVKITTNSENATRNYKFNQVVAKMLVGSKSPTHSQKKLDSLALEAKKSNGG